KGVLDAVMLRQGERAAELVEEFCLHQRNLVLESLLRVKQIEMAWARRQRR
ncbi:MAG: GntR family transcriptional regulator, partial [Moraxellaceae bacterium]|nr:GntR family transcriptional regulator [Moraxellaceae bacterium]